MFSYSYLGSSVEIWENAFLKKKQNSRTTHCEVSEVSQNLELMLEWQLTYYSEYLIKNLWIVLFFIQGLPQDVSCV